MVVSKSITMMSLHVYTLIAFMLFANASGFNHWLVTEDGKIQYQVRSAPSSYTLVLVETVVWYSCAQKFDPRLSRRHGVEQTSANTLFDTSNAHANL